MSNTNEFYLFVPDSQEICVNDFIHVKHDVIYAAIVGEHISVDAPISKLSIVSGSIYKVSSFAPCEKYPNFYRLHKEVVYIDSVAVFVFHIPYRNVI